MSIKTYVKYNLATERHPFFLSLWRAAKKLQYIRHSRMSYSEIEAVISEQHMKTFGRPMHWDNPQTYNEKMQIAKLYMPTPIKTRLADKYAVRDWAAEKIGSEYLIPLLGVYDSFDQIDFDALLDRFVIKCNHDNASVTLVKDKSKIDRKALKHKYDYHMSMNWAWHGWEMHYRDIPPKIIIEQYLEGEMNEYKFYCFGGKPYYCFDGFGHRFYDMDWQMQEFTRLTFKPINEAMPRPAQYDELKDIASKLSEGLDQVRVDMYIVGGRIYTGEMTFTTSAGFGRFSPDEWDYKLGGLWQLDPSVRTQVLARSSRPNT